ncbi:hypothetical protein ACTA71_003995 [Dictyostelium dimigraforme]
MEYNSNNSINKNEELFWKVIKNKFLFALIFLHIETTEWNKYQDHRDFNIGLNRKKFKNIKSFEWMVSKKQFQLLKYKIKVGEQIDIDQNGIIELFKMNCNNNNNIIILKELLSIVIIKMENKEIMNFNLLELAIQSNNIEAIDILINQPFSISINKSILEFSILNSNPIIIKRLLNKNKEMIDQEFQNKLIPLIYNNNNLKTKQKEENIQFILNNFNISPFENNNDFNIEKTILSIKTTEKLFNLKFFKLNSIDIEQLENEFKIVGKLFPIEFKIKQLINNNNIKELYNLFSRVSTKFNQNYFSNNYLSDPILELKIILKYIFSTLNIDIFKLFLNSVIFKNENEIKEIKSISQSIKVKYMASNVQIPINQQLLLEFFNLYSSNESIIQNNEFDQTILKFIMSSKSKEQYEQSINSISTKCKRFSFKLPIHFNPYLSSISYYNPILINNFENDENLLKRIENCNIQYQLNALDFLKQSYETKEYIINYLFKTNQNNHLNENSFKLLIGIISEEDKNYFKDIKLNFNQFFNQSSVILLNSISVFSSKIIDLMFENNFNPIISNTNSFMEQFEVMFNQYYNKLNSINCKFTYKSNKIVYGLYSMIDENEVIKCIEIFIQQFNIHFNFPNTLSIIINSYFRILIKIKNVSFERVLNVYKLIKETIGNRFDDCSIYHSINYLRIKSPKLLKYILDKPFLTPLSMPIPNTMIYHFNIIQSKEIQNSLNPNQFTFDFIFNSNFDIILEKLMFNFTFNSILNQQIIQQKDFNLLNSELKYCLEIRRFDLFFNYLKLINWNNNNFKLSKSLLKISSKILNNNLYKHLINYEN